jgi:hypothetical protein
LEAEENVADVKVLRGFESECLVEVAVVVLFAMEEAVAAVATDTGFGSSTLLAWLVAPNATLS